MKRIHTLPLALSLLLGTLPAHAIDIVKDDNTTNVNVGSSWVGGNVPTNVDTAVFDDTYTQTGNLGTGGTNPQWLGIRVEGNLATLITINNTNTAAWVNLLTGGIDMSAATRDFKIVNLSVGDNQAWNVATGQTLTVGGTRFQGTGNVDITGDGLVVINSNGAGVYSGTMSVSGGTLDLNDFDSGNLVVNSGGTLDSTASLGGNLTVNGGSVNQTGTITGNLSVADGATFSNEIFVTGTVTLGTTTGSTLGIDPISTAALDAGALTLNGTNTVELTSLPGTPVTADVVLYTSITGGTANLQLDPAVSGDFRNTPTFADTGSSITLSILAGDSITWTGTNNADWDIAATQNWDNGAATEFYQLDSVTFDDTASEFAIDVAEDVSVGSMTFSNPVNAYTISGGSIVIGTGISAAGDATISSPVTLAAAQTFSASTGQKLKLGGTINAGSNEITIDGDGTVELNNGGSANQISNGAGIVKNGSGTLIMSGRNTNSGNVTVNGGTVSFVANNWSAANFGGRLIVNAGATAEAKSQVFGSGGRNFDITDGTLTLTGVGTYFTTGSGTSNLDGATINHTGGGDPRTRGTFHILGDSPSTSTTASWKVYGNTTWNVEDVTGDDAADFTLTTEGSGGLNDQNNRTLVKNGAGTMVLNGITKLNGATSVFNVNAGTMVLNATADAIDVATWNVADDAGLAGEGSIGGSLTLGAGTGANLGIDVSTSTELAVGTALTLDGSSTVSLSGTPYTSSVVAVISYGDTLTGDPSTLLALDAGSAANYRSSAFSNVGKTIVLDLGSKPLVWNTGTWNVQSDMNWNAGVDQFYWGDEVTFDDTAASGAVTIDNSLGSISPSVITVNNSTTPYTFTGDAIIGGASLTKSGSGILTLSNSPNTYTNGTTINGGTIAITASDLLPLGGDLTVNSPGVFDMGGFDQTVGALTGDGSVTTGGGTLTIGSGSFSGVISEAGSLVKTGSSSAILSGANSYAGTTTISGGSLQVGDGGTSGSLGAGTVTNNGALAFNRSDDITVSGVSGSGSLTQMGSGTMFLTDDTNSHSGGTTVAAGTLHVGSGGTTGTLPAGPLVNNGALIFERSDDLTIAGLTGGGTITQQGTGTLFVDGPIDQNSTTDYPTWFFNAGTVSVSNRDELHNDGIAAATTVFTFDGGTLRFDGWVGGETFGGFKEVQLEAGGGTISTDAGLTVTIDGLVKGTGDLTKAGDGTLVLTDPNTYSGDTTVDAGTLQLNSTYLDDASTVNINGSGVLDLNHGASDKVDALVIGGVPQADGTYGSTSSTATNQDDTHFAGTGVLQVGDEYTTWATGHGLQNPWLGVDPALNGEPGADPDLDGYDNGVEFVLGEDPNSGLLVNPPTATSSGTDYIFTFRLTDEAASYSPDIWTVEFDEDLIAPWTTAVDPGNATIATTPNGDGSSTVTVTIPKGAEITMFIRLSVTIP